MIGVEGAGAVFIGLLAVAVLIAIIAERLRIPAAVALVAVGAFVNWQPPFAFGDTLLYVFLPPLIFEAAWNIDLAALRRTGLRIAVLAAPGVVATTAIIAAGIAVTGVLPLLPAVLLGSIVAATDPVAVIAVFRKLAVPGDLQVLVEGESIANDGVAIIVYGSALALAGGAHFDAWFAVGQGLFEIIGGTIVGVIVAFVVSLIMGRSRDGQIIVTSTVVLAFSAYYAAHALQTSGIFATAAAAIALRTLSERAGVDRHEDAVHSFWGTLAFIANAVVFFLTGILVHLPDMARSPLLVIVAITVVVLARSLLAVLFIRPWAWTVTVSLSGMRGALSLALALSLPSGIPYRDSIIDAVFGVVLFTLVVQGFALEPVLRRLRFAPSAGGET